MPSLLDWSNVSASVVSFRFGRDGSTEDEPSHNHKQAPFGRDIVGWHETHREWQRPRSRRRRDTNLCVTGDPQAGPDPLDTNAPFPGLQPLRYGTSAYCCPIRSRRSLPHSGLSPLPSGRVSAAHEIHWGPTVPSTAQRAPSCRSSWVPPMPHVPPHHRLVVTWAVSPSMIGVAIESTAPTSV